jgi:hypothetical protein
MIDFSISLPAIEKRMKQDYISRTGVRPVWHDQFSLFAAGKSICYIFLEYIQMGRMARPEISEFINDKGQVFGRTFGAAWLVPDSVELDQGKLTIWSTRQYWSRKQKHSVGSSPGLLDKFLSLADVSDATASLRSMETGVTPSREKILRFARQYGGLQIFYSVLPQQSWPDTVHIEYCEIWRYFAGAMAALLRIGAEFYQGRTGAETDWQIISSTPKVMRKVVQSSDPDLLQAFALSNEENWLVLAEAVSKPNQRTKVVVGHLANTLLGLGGVRPWLTWPDTRGAVARPRITYFGSSLLSELALQLCLRLVKVDTLLVCVHCHKLYSPVVRAPKAGQRNFCPDCRHEEIPKAYALKDFRERQRRGDQKKPKKERG